MPAHYHNITLDNMNDFLAPQGFKIVNGNGKRLRDLSSTVEIVFAKRVDSDGLMLSLRIFTGINPSGESRGVGEDAIRVQLAQKADDGTEFGKVYTIGGSRRVHRVDGWKKNLQARLDRWMEQIGPKCPKCSSLMTERSGKNGKFWACPGYPTCKQTLPINTDTEAPLCPSCQGVMVRRRSQRGEFYGCSKYPNCRGTLPIDE
jgi:topoisomerase-like DNA binding C4 zinc finger protein